MNLFEIAAVLTLNHNEYDKGLRDAESKANGFGSNMGSFVSGVAKAGVAAVGAAAAAVGGIVKQSVNAYSEYQQMVGGAQLMFGDSYAKVAKNAKEAFSTVQMSASAYLEQANKYATGLKMSLNG